MNVRDRVAAHLDREGETTGTELASVLGISRQALNKHIQKLTREGTIEKIGVTKGVRYRLRVPSRPRANVVRFGRTCRLDGLHEHEVYQEMRLSLHLDRQVSKGVERLVSYAFTEMLNNAIDHSQSERCQIEAVLDTHDIRFCIRDRGIGIFHSIASKLGLSDENAAIGELIKGKTTTLPERHSGEGVFFTSKAGDLVTFRSHQTELVFDNRRKDVFVAAKRRLKGTEVSFAVSRRSGRDLSAVFSTYAPEEFDYRFERTRVFVKLFQTEYVSRSEARRMLSGLDRFRSVSLDFKGVDSLGQGFADEIFRVYRRVHPEVEITAVNLSPTLQAMMQHVVDNDI